jgi:putative ABC transport system permease protein
VAAFLSIQLLNTNAISQFKATLDEVAGSATLEVVPTVATTLNEAAVFSALRQGLDPLWPERIPFYPVLEQYLLASPTGGEANTAQALRVLALDMTSTAPQARQLSWAAQGKPTNDLAIFEAKRVYIGHGLAKRYGLAVGQPWPVWVDDRPDTLTIAGILGDKGLGGASSGQLVIMDIASAQALWGQQGQLSTVQVLAPPQSVERVRAALAPLLPANVQLQPPARRGQQVEALLASYRYNLTALSMVALMVAGFLIYNTLSVTVLRRQAQVGTLRALGASHAHVVLAYLTEGAALGALGSGLGVALGLALAYGLSGLVGNTTQLIYGVPAAEGLQLNPPLLALAWALGLAVALTGSVLPAWQAASVSPAYVARSQQGHGHVGAWPWWVALLGALLGGLAWWCAGLPTLNGVPVFGFVASTLGVLGLAACVPLVLHQGLRHCVAPLLRCGCWVPGLALQQVVVSLGRCAVAVASLMVAVAMMISLTIMITSFRHTVNQWVQQSFKADVLVQPLGVTINRNAGRLAQAQVAQLANLPGVAGINAFLEVPVQLSANTHPNGTHQAWLGVGDWAALKRHGDLRFTGGQSFERIMADVVSDPDAILISEPLANKLGLAQGDTLPLPAQHGLKPMRVAGVYYDYASDQGYVLVSDAWYKAQIGPITHWSSVAVFTQPGTEADTLSEAILATFGPHAPVLARTNQALKSEILRIFDATFTITYAMQAIALAVAVLAVATTLLALLMEHRRELALLWAQGASMHQLRQVLRGQALWLSATGYTLGAVLGYGLALLLIFVVNKQAFGWTLGLVVPWPLLALEGGLFMGVGVLAAGLPLRQLGRHIGPQALAYE